MAKQKGPDISPELQKIFDDIVAFMGNDYSSVNTTSSVDGAGINQSVQCQGHGTDRWNFSQYVPGIRTTVSPSQASLGPGGIQQFTAAATNPDGTPVAAARFAWAILPGGAGSIDANGLYTAPATIEANAASSVRCSLQGTQSYTTFSISLHP